MTAKEWKKNDALMRAALKKMGIVFYRNPTTWEAKALKSKAEKLLEYDCYNEYNSIVLEGPNDPESLGQIMYFYFMKYVGSRIRHRTVDNIFFGVKNYEELKIKLDLMA